MGSGLWSAMPAEGEPATFKDRLLLRTNQVLEGLAIAASAVGAERAYIGLKETFTTEIQALTRALGEMRERTRSAALPWRSSWARICTCWGRRPGWRR
jgi:Na+-translocating ferredoxin:NAD+ oxidoreductase RnfC subunit